MLEVAARLPARDTQWIGSAAPRRQQSSTAPRPASPAVCPAPDGRPAESGYALPRAPPGVHSTRLCHVPTQNRGDETTYPHRPPRRHKISRLLPNRARKQHAPCRSGAPCKKRDPETRANPRVRPRSSGYPPIRLNRPQCAGAQASAACACHRPPRLPLGPAMKQARASPRPEGRPFASPRPRNAQRGPDRTSRRLAHGVDSTRPATVRA